MPKKEYSSLAKQDILRAKELVREIKEGNYEHRDNPGF